MKILTKKQIAKKNFQRFIYPKDIDEELVDVLDVFNNIPGCRTMFSCCGHGEETFYLTLCCTSDFTKQVILDYFKSKNIYDDVDSDLDAGDKNRFSIVPETHIGVYSNVLGFADEKTRKIEYKAICKHFLQYVPKEHW